MPGMPKTPGFVIAAAVLLFVDGGLGLMCNGCGVGSAVMVAAVPAPEGPAQQGDLLAQERELTRRIPSYTAVECCAYLCKFVLCGAMIAAGVGALGLKPFGRYVGTGAVAVDLLITSLHTIYAVAVVLPVNGRILEEQAQVQNMPIVADIAQTTTWATLIAAYLFTLILTVLIIAFLNARKSRDAFVGKFEPEPHEELLARFDALDEEAGEYRRPRSAPPRAPGDTGIQGKPD